MIIDDWIDIQTLEFECGKCGHFLAVFAKQKGQAIWLVAGMSEPRASDQPVLSVDGVTVVRSDGPRGKVFVVVPSEAVA